MKKNNLLFLPPFWSFQAGASNFSRSESHQTRALLRTEWPQKVKIIAHYSMRPGAKYLAPGAPKKLASLRLLKEKRLYFDDFPGFFFFLHLSQCRWNNMESFLLSFLPFGCSIANKMSSFSTSAYACLTSTYACLTPLRISSF